MSDQNNYSILVSSLDCKVTEKQLADFFSFCGTITSLVLRKHDNSSDAIITFESEPAYKTALLLSNALINEKPITVSPFVDSNSIDSVEEDKDLENTPVIYEMPQEEITKRPDEEVKKVCYYNVILFFMFILILTFIRLLVKLLLLL